MSKVHAIFFYVKYPTKDFLSVSCCYVVNILIECMIRFHFFSFLIIEREISRNFLRFGGLEFKIQNFGIYLVLK